LERIAWTYDPLLSTNARLNIAKLGAVCNTYLRDLYGEMRDRLNVGFPSDRFRVDWWVHSRRVLRRLSRQKRLTLDLAHYLDAGAEIINRSNIDEAGWPLPPWRTMPSAVELPGLLRSNDIGDGGSEAGNNNFVPVLMVEIPADYQALKDARPSLALEWRLHSRELFEHLFYQGYLVTDFVHLPGAYPRSFYVLSHGEQTL
jgi:predicted GNAT superfamily acetyltransferase